MARTVFHRDFPVLPLPGVRPLPNSIDPTQSLCHAPQPPGPLAQTQAMFAALQARARAAGATLRAPPPLPTACCGRGCNGCVWEGFYEAAAYWREEAELRLR